MIDLQPNDLQSVLSHDYLYKRAVKVLLEQWDTEGNQLFSDQIKAGDIIFARKLQQAGLIQGSKDFSDYQSVQEFVVQHDQWLSGVAKTELISKFE